MRETVFEAEQHGRIELRARVDSRETDAANRAERRSGGDGFTRGRTMRALCEIDADELSALLMNNDRDAVSFVNGQGATRRLALRRLLRRFPEWKITG